MSNPNASSPTDPQVLTRFQEERARAAVPGLATTGPAVWPRFAGRIWRSQPTASRGKPAFWSFAHSPLVWLLLCLAIPFGCAGPGPAPRIAALGAAGASHEAPKGLASLSVPAQGTISAALGRDDPAYHASVENSGLTARNPKHRFEVRFGPGGPEVASGKARFGHSLEKLGYGDDLRPVVPAAPKAKQNRIEYSRGPLTEWYANGPLGLQQGFTLDAPPAGRGGGPLTLALRLSGRVRASLDGDTLILASPGGQGVLRYRGLTVFDATGRGLSANLALLGNTLRIRVEDHRARYPVTIDPLFEDAKLTGGGEW